jgi:hypothetical protein
MEAVRKKKKWAEVIPIKLANCALNNKDSLHIFCTSFLRIGFQKKINNDNKFVMVEAGGIEPRTTRSQPHFTGGLLRFRSPFVPKLDNRRISISLM